MSRDHAKSHDSAGSSKHEDDTQPSGPNRQQMVALKISRQQMVALKISREFRAELHKKAEHAYPETVMQALLIDRTMLGTDAKEAAQHKLEPDIAGRVGESIFDKIKEHLVKSGGEMLGLVEHFSGALLGAFDAARDTVKQNIEARAKVTEADITEGVINGAFKAMEKYKASISSVIDGIPPGALVAAYRSVEAEEGKASEEDDDVKEAVRERAVERACGMPQTGGARAHELAKMFYDEIKVEVRSTKPVHEQVDEIAEDRKDPNKTERKARAAELEMSEADGSGFAENIKKDEAARGRAAEVSP